MIPRYTREKMASIWTDEYKYNLWLKIELIVCEKLYQMNVIPKKDYENIRNKAAYNIEEMRKIETEVKHDMIAFLSSVAKAVGESGRYIHLGLTSSDILDTALACQLKEAMVLIIDEAYGLMESLRRQAIKYKATPIIGRTHGIHAEPTTFGLKMLVFHNEIERNIKRLEFAKEEIAYGKISGAVGNFANIDPAVEAYVCERLGIKPAPVSTQIIQRDRHAHFFTTLAILGGTLEKIATEIRHLQRTEVGEVSEGFAAGQKGSSAMPHKKNPIGSENISGVARLLRANAMAALENMALWHERDISHSSVERVIVPDSTILADYALSRMKDLIDTICVDEHRMDSNISLSKGLPFTGRVLLGMTNAGMSREQAYTIIQRNSGKTMENGKHLRENLMKDEELKKAIGDDKIKEIMTTSFDLGYYFKNIPVIFGRSLK